MDSKIGRRLSVVAVFLAAGVVVACGGKVDEEDFNQSVSEIQSSLDQHDSRISQNAADISDLDSRVSSLEQDLQDMRENFQAQISELEEGMRFALPVHFEFDVAQIRSVDRPLLDRFASVVRSHYSGSTVTVEGFADPAGTQAYNDQLSRERAQNVADYLVSQGGLSESNVRAVGYGESQDRLVTDRQGPGQQGLENRRVTFVVEWNGETGMSGSGSGSGF